MSTTWAYTLLSVLLVSIIALIGIVTFPIKTKRFQNFLAYLVSFSAGAFLGDVFIHLLPEAVEEAGFTLEVSFYILLGLVVSFAIEKVIHWRHSHLSGVKKHYHPSAIMSLIGDTIHNFIDGLIIGTSYLINIPVGIATTVAVIFHEIPQEIGNFGVLLYGGISKNRAIFLNFVTALTAILGAVVALLAGSSIEGSTKFLIPFTAGHFIYIAGSDLIPELHKEVVFKKSAAQFAYLVLGILAMAVLLFLE